MEKAGIIPLGMVKGMNRLEADIIPARGITRPIPIIEANRRRVLDQFHHLRGPARLGEHRLLGRVRPGGARKDVGGDERHARPAAAEDVAPDGPRGLQGRRRRVGDR